MNPAYPKIGLVCSEALRETMAGIGIRYFELARNLVMVGFEVVLIHPGSTHGMLEGRLPNVTLRTYDPKELQDQLGSCEVVIAQGYLANEVAVKLPKIPKVFDFYDPWLIENLTYTETLGWDPFFNDLASWRLQFETGDFFLCSSEAQRQFYLGFLAALGRINPNRVADDPDLRGLIAPVPFGIQEQLPDYHPLLPEKKAPCKRILFGGLYDWYDPWTLLKALELLEQSDWQVFFVLNPNPETTPQQLVGEVKHWAEARDWLDRRVLFLDWVPISRRFDLLRDVDVLVAPHRMSLETRLCMRTRYLDAIATGCPAIASAGGTIAELLENYGAGAVVANEDPQQMAKTLVEILWGDRSFTQGMARLGQELSWRKALQPLVEFCLSPRLDPSKEIVGSTQIGASKWQVMTQKARRKWRRIRSLGRWS